MLSNRDLFSLDWTRKPAFNYYTSFITCKQDFDRSLSCGFLKVVWTSGSSLLLWPYIMSVLYDVFIFSFKPESLKVKLLASGPTHWGKLDKEAAVLHPEPHFSYQTLRIYLQNDLLCGIELFQWLDAWEPCWMLFRLPSLSSPLSNGFATTTTSEIAEITSSAHLKQYLWRQAP